MLCISDSACVDFVHVTKIHERNCLLFRFLLKVFKTRGFQNWRFIKPEVFKTGGFENRCFLNPEVLKTGVF